MSNEISKTQKAEIVFDLVGKIKILQKSIVLNFLEIGKILSELQQNGYWRYYGEHLENFNMFLTEIGFKIATAWNYIRIWRVFGSYKNLEVNFFSLVKLLPVVNENNKDEWLEKAKNLTPNDLNDEIRIAKGKISQLECQHPEEKRVYYFRCEICNKWIQIKKENVET